MKRPSGTGPSRSGPQDPLAGPATGDFHPIAFREAVLAQVARIPRGRLASYGQIARLAGYPGRPRQVGMVLRGLPGDTPLPWHRVVNAAGYVPSRGRLGGALEQIRRLRAEGIAVDGKGGLELAAHRWQEGLPGT